MNGIIAMLLANDNTSEVAEGLGFIKGANCTISDIELIVDEEGNATGNRVTFEWIGSEGTVLHQSIDILNGKDGSGTGDDPEIPEDDIDSICQL